MLAEKVVLGLAICAIEQDDVFGTTIEAVEGLTNDPETVDRVLDTISEISTSGSTHLQNEELSTEATVTGRSFGQQLEDAAKMLAYNAN